MFFGFFDRADKNGDGKVDIWETAEELYAYDSIMGTNLSGFCPENDRRKSELYDEEEECFDDEYEDDDGDCDIFGDEFDFDTEDY